MCMCVRHTFFQRKINKNRICCVWMCVYVCATRAQMTTVCAAEFSLADTNGHTHTYTHIYSSARQQRSKGVLTALAAVVYICVCVCVLLALGECLSKFRSELFTLVWIIIIPKCQQSLPRVS